MPPIPPGHLLSFRPKQLAANAHDETSRSVIITLNFGLWKCEQISHLLGDKAKILPVEETVKPQIHEVNIMKLPVLTVTNTTQATTSERLMKINCIVFYS